MRATDQAAPVVPTFGTPKPAWMAGTGLVVALERLPQSAYVWDDVDPDVVWYGEPEPVGVTATLLGAGGDTTPATPVVTPSIAPTANALQLLFVSYARDTAQFSPAPASIVGNGLTWVQIAATQYRATGQTRNACYLYRAMAAAPTAGTTTITHGFTTGSTNTDMTWQWIEFTAVDTSGTNGSGAVVQTVVGTPTTAGGLTPAVSLAAFASAANATFTAVAWGNYFGRTATVAGFTVLDGEEGPAGSVHTDAWIAFRPDNASNPITWTIFNDAGSGAITAAVAIGVEIRAASSTARDTPATPRVDPGEELVWDAPLTGIAYTDVWCDLEELTVTAGQPDVFDGFQTGHCRLVLRDPGDGRYTLRTPDGRLVYYAPGRRLAVYWLDEVGEPWWVFHGAIATWRQPGLDGRVEIDAYACPAWLAQTTGTTWTAGTAGQLPRPRLTAIAAAAGFVGPVAFDLGDVTLSVPEAADVFPLDVMRRSAASDAGILFADADDTLIYRDRRWRDGRTDQGDVPTFTDNVCALPPGAVVVWAPVAADVDLRLAGTVRLENAAEPPLLATADGSDYVDPRIVFSHAEADLWRTQPEGDAVAAHEAAVRSDARMALATFDVHLHDRRFDYWAQCVDRRLGDRIRWQHADNYTSDPPQTVLYDLDMVLTTLNHRVTPDGWTVTMGTAPAVGYTAVELWDVTGLTWDSADPLTVWR